MIRLKKGWDIPLFGAPEQKVYSAHESTTVALLGPDYNQMKPTMLVQQGERVKKGQAVFRCKRQEGVIYTAPGGGVVKAIQRGDRRKFEALVIELDSPGKEQALSFDTIRDFSSSSQKDVQRVLLESGMWTAFRTRPYSKCPRPDARAANIFVCAMDTSPLAADPK